MKNFRVLCLAALAAVCLVPSISNATNEPSAHWLRSPEPSWVFVAGPGTVVSVRLRDLPFIKPQYILKFKTDTGELIELRYRGSSAPVIEGMHGTDLLHPSGYHCELS